MGEELNKRNFVEYIAEVSNYDIPMTVIKSYDCRDDRDAINYFLDNYEVVMSIYRDHIYDEDYRIY